MAVNAIYFDGTSAFGHEVQLAAEGEQLALTGYTSSRRYQRSECRLAEPFAAAPCVVEFQDGSHCVVPSQERSTLMEMMQYLPSRIERWQARWAGALLAVVVMIALIVLAYVKGVPALANAIVDAMPIAAEQRLGDVALRQFEESMLKPSSFSDQRLAEIGKVFERVRPNAKRMPVRLLVRESEKMGANAFALPNGTIVVTDDLVRLLIGKGEVKDAEAELAGILAHEIGHVELRHSLRGLTKASLTLAGSWALLGDFSAVAAGLPALVQQLTYSRAMEHEADAFAGVALKRTGLSPAALADALTTLQETDTEDSESEEELPDWMRTSFGFLSTHPGTSERVERLYGMD